MDLKHSELDLSPFLDWPQLRSIKRPFNGQMNTNNQGPDKSPDQLNPGHPLCISNIFPLREGDQIVEKH